MQLEWMTQLQNYRNEYLDVFFKFLNFFDTAYFLFILIPFIVIGISYRWGIKIFYLIITNGLINYTLKLIFKIPRPCIHVPDLALVRVGEYSFPSGAAQFSILLAFLLIYFWKSPLAKIIGISYVILIGSSRIYLGVHYPTDILGGWVFGFLLFYLFLKSYSSLEKTVQKYKVLSLFLSIVIPTLLITLFQDRKLTQFLSGFSALSIGTYISFRYKIYLKDPQSFLSSILRGGIAIISTFIFYFLFIQMKGISELSKILIANVILSLWITLGINLLMKKLCFR